MSSSPPPYPYKEIHSLIVLWADDDLDLWWELDDLNKAFEKFRFTSRKIFYLPSENPYAALASEIQAFTDGKEDALLVFYYSGHGYLDDFQHLRWAASG